jgi:hypothetical protein
MDGLELGNMKHRLMTHVDIGPITRENEGRVDAMRRLVDDLDLPDYEKDTEPLKDQLRPADVWYNSCIVMIFAGIGISLVVFVTILVLGFFDIDVDFISVMLTSTIGPLVVSGYFFARAYREYLNPELV